MLSDDWKAVSSSPADEHVACVLVRLVERSQNSFGIFVAGQLAVLVRVEPFQQGVLQRAGFVAIALHGDIDDAVPHDGRGHHGAEQRVAGPQLLAGGRVISLQLAAAGDDEVGPALRLRTSPARHSPPACRGGRSSSAVLPVAASTANSVGARSSSWLKMTRSLIDDRRRCRAPVHEIRGHRQRHSPGFLASRCSRARQADRAEMDIDPLAVGWRAWRRRGCWAA